MKEIKTVALVGLGAIGAYFADRLQPVLGEICVSSQAVRVRSGSAARALSSTASRNTTTLWSRVRASLPIW